MFAGLVPWDFGHVLFDVSGSTSRTLGQNQHVLNHAWLLDLLVSQLQVLRIFVTQRMQKTQKLDSAMTSMFSSPKRARGCYMVPQRAQGELSNILLEGERKK